MFASVVASPCRTRLRVYFALGRYPYFFDGVVSNLIGYNDKIRRGEVVSAKTDDRHIFPGQQILPVDQYQQESA
ncbi:hypothetical protein [Photobacterium satsumensis]|uniref:hypothetical protein n=1 Tax=Photobacterium satsumensis TaxID=2910239 RepID=UPI003D12A454